MPEEYTFYYFKPRGKWAYEGVGLWADTREEIYELNNGMPGITGKAEDLIIVGIPIGDHGWPRMINASR